MPDSNSLLSSWLDRRLTGDEVAQLSTRLARDPGLADEMVEMTELVLALSALAGCTLAVIPNPLSFIPIKGSPTKPLTQRITAAPEAHESVRNFCATGTLPPAWGLPDSEFHATPQPDGSLELTATEWRLAQLEQVIEAMDAPLLTVEVMVFSLPPAEVLEKHGLRNFGAIGTAEAEALASEPDIGESTEEATAPSPPPSSQIKGGFPIVAAGTVSSESQWSSLRPAFLESPDSVLTEFSVAVIPDQWTDLGERAPDVLRWDTQSLGLKAVLDADDYTLQLSIGSRPLNADPATKPAGTTSISVWMGHYLLLGYTESAATPGSPPRGLMLRVQPLD
jgi:hypothetical protein